MYIALFIYLWGEGPNYDRKYPKIQDDFPLRSFNEAVKKNKLVNSMGILAFSYEGGKFNK